MDTSLDFAPPFGPDDEVLATDARFETACLLESASMAKSANWELLSPLMTRSEKFGLVWRVDFRFPLETDDHEVNRIMLWKLPNGEWGRFFGANIGVPPLR
jgi:hypothetical protein